MDVPEADTFLWHSRYPSAGQNAISAPSPSASCASPACCPAQDGRSRWAMDAPQCSLAQNITSLCLAAIGVALLSPRRSVFRRQPNHRDRVCGPVPSDPRASNLARRVGQVRDEHSSHELGEEEVIYGLPRLYSCTGTMPQSWQRPETRRQGE